MTFSIDNPEGGCHNPPLGKYVWEKPSGEQGLNLNMATITLVIQTHVQMQLKITQQNYSGSLYATL